MNKFPLILIIVVLLYGCNSRNNNNTLSSELPSNWSKYSAVFDVNCDKSQNWWLRFDDPNLNNLIKEALNTNFDFLTAMSNVSKAQAELNVDSSYLLPQIGIQGEAKKTKTNSPKKTVNSVSLAAVLSYEIDLWGRAANAEKSARADLLAAKYNQEAVKLAVVSNVTVAYFNLVALNEQLVVTEELITNGEEIYKLTNHLFDSGTIDLISLKQEESVLAIIKASLPLTEQLMVEQEKALAILLGKDPKQIVEGVLKVNKDKLRSRAITVPAILPSELLEQRPDIKAAEQSLISSNLQVAIVKASYFPTVSLNALLGLSNSRVKKLFDDSSKNSSVGVSFSDTIIDFGKTSNNIKIAEENQKQAVIQYQKTLSTAFQEAVIYLSAQQTSSDNLKFIQKSEKALEESMKSTMYRYNNGNVSYVEVLRAKQSLLQAKLDRINAALKQLVASVNLFQALGGNWHD